jgi:hypothetical protein
MAKVKIQGHASGTGVLTVTAPNTSTDRTITLPDATGTLLNSDGDGSNLTGLSSFNPDAAVVINESGADVDFRVESDTKVNAFTVNGATGRVGVNRGTDPDARLEVSAASETGLTVTATVSGEYGVIVTSGSTNSTPIIDLRDTNNTSQLKVLADGRGLSQFTAKAWARVDMESSTMALTDSHNISSVTDRGVGLGRVTFANSLANANYCAVGNALDGGGENDVRIFNHSNETSWTTTTFDWYTTDSTTSGNDAMNATIVFFGD